MTKFLWLLKLVVAYTHAHAHTHTHIRITVYSTHATSLPTYTKAFCFNEYSVLLGRLCA